MEEADLTTVSYKGSKWYKTRLKGVTDRNLHQEQEKQIGKIQAALQEQEKRVDLIEKQQEEFAKELKAIEESIQTANEAGAKRAAEQLEQVKDLTVRLGNVELFKLRHEVELARLDTDQEEQKKQIMHLQETIKQYQEEFKKLSEEVIQLKSVPKTKSLLKIGEVEVLKKAKLANMGGNYNIYGNLENIPTEWREAIFAARLNEMQGMAEAQALLKDIKSSDPEEDVEIGKVKEFLKIKGALQQQGKLNLHVDKPKETPVPSSTNPPADFKTEFKKRLERLIKDEEYNYRFSVERPADNMLVIKRIDSNGAPDDIEKELADLVVLLKQGITSKDIKEDKYNLDTTEEDTLKITAGQSDLDKIASLLETPVKAYVDKFKLSNVRAALYFKDRQKLLKSGMPASELVGECKMQ